MSDNPPFEFTETQDWFSHNIPTWKEWANFLETPAPRILEIGSWEGRSGVWMLSTLCSRGGSLVCVDHFDLMQTEAGRERFNKIRKNLDCTGKDYRVLPMFSVPALITLLKEEMVVPDPGYDWIYVDGSHEADDTLLDAELAWRLSRKGAIFILDDYLWDAQPVESEHHPKRGIDAFLALHAGQYERLSKPSSYQIVLKKTSEMRIGFLSEGGSEDQLRNALGYGVNIVLTIDSTYAIPAAVTIRSAIDCTTGRITFYIVDCGLTEEDRRRINDSIPRRADVSLQFVEPAEDALSVKRGASWAKIDVIANLPVERALYLDADVLVRKNIAELWNTDLQGKPLGAVVDIGFPMGHDNIQRGQYFNAGVLLFDLAQIRRGQDRLTELAQTMRDASFEDQDVLNVHFRDNWHALPLAWNAQGLGTYAENQSAERDAIRPSIDRARADPAIVHFTGPVHPPLAAVLNPYLQPYTAKPWGYAGAPCHPNVGEWWAVLEQTPWRGLRTQPWFAEQSSQARDRAMREGVAQFQIRVKEHFSGAYVD